jgi:predicted nuclease of predicted toxin-antitoxin system
MDRITVNPDQCGGRPCGGAALMTKDGDFVDLLTRHGPPPQIIWLTCGNTTDAALRAVLATAWPRVAELLAAGEPLIEISGRAA